jgi:predicted sugar kinase
VAPQVRRELEREVTQNLVPALQRRDFEAFSDSVYRFGYRAGNCFAPVQGGPYNGPRIARLIEEIRTLGFRGVGQSSWGPTVFCLAENPDSAESLSRHLRSAHGAQGLGVSITAPSNHGAQVVVEA